MQTTDYTVTDLDVEYITIDAPELTLEPMETEQQRHARLIAKANMEPLTPAQLLDALYTDGVKK